ncbi:hypothetical protein [Mycobacteroides abscessus]|uniref:hypothetical protein n=1 Tax=Mycobacteroides abscessus TaxID=36809 RepID=UPI0009A8123C|nr:hypothetical protein [Mycobacteroides abscessus]SKK32086.1 Uncharacterised protein [Mycobacteroides abscessus subsp. abscessus]
MSEAAGAVNPWLVDGPEVEPWYYTDDKKKPGTVSVEPAASNAYGPEIFLQIERGGTKMSIWLDLDTWEQLHQAGVTAHYHRVEATQLGWT